jgi:cyclopropane fatty-acyl-phospholipid synthase-like methyltransferase
MFFKKIWRRIRFDLLYLGAPTWDTGESPPELLRFLGSAEPGRALDLGCGTGTNVLTLSALGWEVVGVDFSLISILRAGRKMRKAGFDAALLRWGDVTQTLVLPGPFDFILDMGCYHNLTESGMLTYRQNLQRWLAPGGVFLLYAHRQVEGSSHGVCEDDLTAFEAFLSKQWREDSGEKIASKATGRPAVWVRYDQNVPHGQFHF